MLGYTVVKLSTPGVGSPPLAGLHSAALRSRPWPCKELLYPLV